mgnify:CR=1 FL=1
MERIDCLKALVPYIKDQLVVVSLGRTPQEWAEVCPRDAVTFGKAVLLPLIGYTLFSWLAQVAKLLHNFTGPLFTVALPRGLWGLVTRGRLRLFPVGYELRR